MRWRRRKEFRLFVRIKPVEEVGLFYGNLMVLNHLWLFLIICGDISRQEVRISHHKKSFSRLKTGQHLR